LSEIYAKERETELVAQLLQETIVERQNVDDVSDGSDITEEEKEKETEKMSSNHVAAPSGKKSRCVCARVFVCVYVCVRWA